MGDLIFTDFKSKDGTYTKGGGIDDMKLEGLYAGLTDEQKAAALAYREDEFADTAPCEMPPAQPGYTAPDKDSA
jgi:hypothetical protein